MLRGVSYFSCSWEEDTGYTKAIQDGQCTYNVTLRRVRATIVAVVKQKELHILRERERESVCVCACV